MCRYTHTPQHAQHATAGGPRTPSGGLIRSRPRPEGLQSRAPTGLRGIACAGVLRRSASWWGGPAVTSAQQATCCARGSAERDSQTWRVHTMRNAGSRRRIHTAEAAAARETRRASKQKLSRGINGLTAHAHARRDGMRGASSGARHMPHHPHSRPATDATCTRAGLPTLGSPGRARPRRLSLTQPPADARDKAAATASGRQALHWQGPTRGVRRISAALCVSTAAARCMHKPVAYSPTPSGLEPAAQGGAEGGSAPDA